MKGKGRKVNVYNKNGELIKVYENIQTANRESFGDMCPTYLSCAFFSNNGIFNKNELTYVRTSERGTTQKIKKYMVKDKKLNKVFSVLSTKELLKIIEYGHNNFHRQMRIYGNYEDDRFNVWSI